MMQQNANSHSLLLFQADSWFNAEVK